MYSKFVFYDHLVSPINGYSCKKINSQNIKQFGFTSVQELLDQFPDFPLICEKSAQILSKAAADARNNYVEKEKIKQRNTYELNPKICSFCKEKISFEKRKNKFCSQSCGASAANKLKGPRAENTKKKISIGLKIYNKLFPKLFKPLSEDHKQKISKAMQEFDGPATRIFPTICSVCKIFFWATKNGKKCCSKSCRDQICSQNKSKITNYEYFNKNENSIIILQSSWELKIAEWLDINKVVWLRPKKRFIWFDTTLQKNRTYLPDFYLPKFELYLDVKNPFKQKEDADKISQLLKLINLRVGNIQSIKASVNQLLKS